jgi:hypothetical protein
MAIQIRHGGIRRANQISGREYYLLPAFSRAD